MPELFALLAECHVDTTLARALVRGNRKLVEHIFGVPKLSARLLKLAEAKQQTHVVGMVDWDRGTVLDFPGMRPFAAHPVPGVAPATHGYGLYQHPDHPTHFLVTLGPACDRWLFEQAGAAGLPPADYGLPATFAEFLSFTKTAVYEDHPYLVALLKALHRGPSPAFGSLRKFIQTRAGAAGHTIW